MFSIKVGRKAFEFSLELGAVFLRIAGKEFYWSREEGLVR
jgi:hypothetical protein